MIKDLVLKNRSFRRFHQSPVPDATTLKELVDLARLSPSSANMQPFKFYLSNDPRINTLIFPQLAWAGYLVDWPGPSENERPTAYIIILGDKTIKTSFGCDHGIAAQSILLGAVEKGFGGCMIASVKREPLHVALKLDEKYEILLVIALGKPAEEVQIEPVGADGSVKYWRDEKDVHHVPKRSLDDLVIND